MQTLNRIIKIRNLNERSRDDRVKTNCIDKQLISKFDIKT